MREKGRSLRRSLWAKGVAFGGAQRLGGADQALARDQRGEFILAPVVRSGGTPRQHHPSYVRGTVVHTNGNVSRHIQTEHLRKRTARVAHDLLSIRLALVPPGCIAEEIVRVARAQGADD